MKNKMIVAVPAIVAGSVIFGGCASQKPAAVFQNAAAVKRTEIKFGAAGNTHSINWQKEGAGDTLYNLKIKSTYLTTPWRVLSWAKRVTGIDSLLNTASLDKKLDWVFKTSKATLYFDHEKTAILFQPDASMAKADAKVQIVNQGVATNMDSTFVIGSNKYGAIWLSPAGKLVCLPYGQTRPVLIDMKVDKSAYYTVVNESDKSSVLVLEKNGKPEMKVKLTRTAPEKMVLDNLKEKDTRDRSANDDNSVGTQADTKRLTIEGHNNLDMANMMQKYGLKDGMYSFDSTIVFPYTSDYPLYGALGVESRAAVTVTNKGVATITFPAVGNNAYVSNNYMGGILNKHTAAGNVEILPKGATACDYFVAYSSVENDSVAFSVTSVAEGGTVTLLGIGSATGLIGNTGIAWKPESNGNLSTELTCNVMGRKGVRVAERTKLSIASRSPIVPAPSVEAAEEPK